ncbi:MAG: PTS fructose transporter subunit IIA [Pseudomonadota bacterium]|nr:PTS fructose transporter subunit IIA [Pseudomonadota bacterium]
MIGIVIVAHGGLAQEYLAALEHVMGKQVGITAVSIKNDDDRAAKQDEICSAADKVDRGAGVVIVTDIFGGSPSNLAMLACRPDDRRIVYGANLPMLLKLAKSRGLIIDDAVKVALSSGRQYLDAKNISNTGY